MYSSVYLPVHFSRFHSTDELALSWWQLVSFYINWLCSHTKVGFCPVPPGAWTFTWSRPWPCSSACLATRLTIHTRATSLTADCVLCISRRVVHGVTPWIKVLRQEIPNLLRNQKVHYCSYNSLPPVPILSQVGPIHTFPPYFVETHYQYAMAQVVSRRPLTVEARVRAWVSPCETDWHWDRFFLEFFGFTLSVSFHHGCP
jgi:hypothetical protein